MIFPILDEWMRVLIASVSCCWVQHGVFPSLQIHCNPLVMPAGLPLALLTPGQWQIRHVAKFQLPVGFGAGPRGTRTGTTGTRPSVVVSSTIYGSGYGCGLPTFARGKILIWAGSPYKNSRRAIVLLVVISQSKVIARPTSSHHDRYRRPLT